MICLLDEACNRSADPPEGGTIVVSQRTTSGKRGRPRVHIDPEFLQEALTLRGPTHLAPVFHCSARTVRRRALELNLVNPGPPVATHTVQPNGITTITYTSSSPAVSAITDEQLDSLLTTILQTFPNFGRNMLTGRLRDAGFRIPRARLLHSYIRVHGPSAIFGDRSLHRSPYSVAGANALWHHDGQHGMFIICGCVGVLFSCHHRRIPGLIRFKIVIHAFIDGHSRFVVSLRASNNNRASTVFDIFREGAAKHGLPSRVRGDHGTENLKVAEYMEETRGVSRGSYIWGRCVQFICALETLTNYNDLGAFTIPGSNAFGMMSHTALARSGRSSFMFSRATTTSTLRCPPTSGFFTTCF